MIDFNQIDASTLSSLFESWLDSEKGENPDNIQISRDLMQFIEDQQTEE